MLALDAQRALCGLTFVFQLRFCITLEEVPIKPPDWWCGHSIPLPPPDPAVPREVHVAYSSDQGFFPGMLASMLSLVSHLRSPRLCVIHLIVARADMPAAHRLLRCFRSHGARFRMPRVRMHEMLPLPFAVNENALQPTIGHNEHVFTRLYLHRYLGNVSRVLWLDSDTLVLTDVAPLYRAKLQHTVAAAILGEITYRDWYLRDIPAPLQRYIPDPDARYFNSGVLLIDLARWQSERFERKVQHWRKVFDRYDDQLLLNLIFPFASYEVLDRSWNLRADKARMCRRKKKGIVHFSDHPKPWQRSTSESDIAVYEHWFAAHRRCTSLD